MKKYFWTIIYKLGGADYSIIQHCAPKTRKPYRHLGYAVIICTGVATISGADITHQYTLSAIITLLGALLFACITFSFDYFINNSNSKKIVPKLLRVPAALANVFLSSAALMVMINQAEVDNKLNAQKTAGITTCDSAYHAEKAERYKADSEKKSAIENYHNTICLPEAKLGYAGPSYMRKHKYCLTQDSILTIEKGQLDAAEVSFYNSYQTKRAALNDVSNSSFPKKCVMLPDVFKENWFTLLVAIAVFIISLFVECQSLIMKFSLNDNDEYKKAEADYSREYSLKTNESLKRMLEHSTKMADLKTEQANSEIMISWADAKLTDIIKKTPTYYRLKEYARIFRENGMPELADETNHLQTTISNHDDVMEKFMNHVIKKMNKN